MFKKSFAALAVLGFCASYANASSVILYGVVDEALVFTHEKFDVTGEEGTKTNTFGLESGLNAPSRFGLRGVEDLGNGLQVSFVAENSFSADDGSLGMGRLFGRELSATVSGDFGRVSLGRMGGVGSSAGSYDLVYAYGDAFDGGDNNIFGLAASSRYDNMVTYQTPDFAGVKATVQYSFNEDSVNDKDREGSSAVNRYASAALTGDFGALQTVLAYEFQNYQSFGTDVNPSVEDGHTVYLGGNYDFEVAKVFVMGQYFKGLKAGSVNALGMLDSIDFDKDNTYLDKANSLYDEGMKGYGLHLGTVVPISNGDLTVGAYYVDGTGESSDATVEERDFDYMGLAAKYEYRLSKRTSVYLGAGYHKATIDATTAANDEIEQKVGEVFTGLTHAF